MEKQNPQFEIPDGKYERLMFFEPYILAIAIDFERKGYSAKARETIKKFLNPENEMDEDFIEFMKEMITAAQHQIDLDPGFRKSQMQQTMDEAAKLPIDPRSYIERYYGQESTYNHQSTDETLRIVSSISSAIENNSRENPFDKNFDLESWSPDKNQSIN